MAGGGTPPGSGSPPDTAGRRRRERLVRHAHLVPRDGRSCSELERDSFPPRAGCCQLAIYPQVHRRLAAAAGRFRLTVDHVASAPQAITVAKGKGTRKLLVGSAFLLLPTNYVNEVVAEARKVEHELGNIGAHG